MHLGRLNQALAPPTGAAWSSCKYTAGPDAAPPDTDGRWVWYTSAMVVLRASHRTSEWSPRADHLRAPAVSLRVAGTLAAADS
jgi:hypothetical protein